MYKSILFEIKKIILILFIFLNFFTSDSRIKEEDNKYLEEPSNLCDSYIKIDSIHLLECLYPMDSKENNMESHVMMYYRNPYVLVAHSGNKSNAFFNDLKELKEEEYFVMKYDGVEEKYKIVKIYSKMKKDLLTLEGDLLFVTCTGSHYQNQLVIVSQKV